MKINFKLILFGVLCVFILCGCNDNKKDITGITFSDKKFAYDGEEHFLEIEGTLPNGVTVNYIGNGQKEVGDYIVTASFSDSTGTYNVPNDMTAKLTIYNNGSHANVKFKYDEKEEHYLVLKGSVFNNIPSIPEKVGYQGRWNYDFSKSITEDITCEIIYELIDFRIIYMLDDDIINNSNNPTSYNYLSNFIQFYSPSDSIGRFFDGWYTTSDFREDSRIYSIPNGSTGDVILYPKFINYKIESAGGFEFNFTDYELPALTMTVGNSKNVLTLSRTIIVSDGCNWVLSKDIEGTDPITTKNISLEVGHNIAYVTVWYNEEFNLVYILDVYKLDMLDYTFVVDGQVYDQGEIEEQSFLNEPISPYKLGYTFLGWKDSINRMVSFPYQVVSDSTIIAEFQPLDYVIEFDANGGVLDSNVKNVKYDQFTVLPTPQRIGYTFVGWETENGQIHSNRFNYKYLKNLLLKAVWEANTYTITYDAAIGVLESLTQEVTYDQPYELYIPSRLGYVFKGYTKDELPFILTEVWTEDEDIILTANWEIEIYNITYELDNGINNEKNISTFTILDRFTFFEPTRVGYKFKGWYYYEGSSEVNNGYKEITSFYEGSYGDFTIYASWEANTYTITYFTEGVDDETLTQTVTYDQPYELYQLTKRGYTLMGYTKDGAIYEPENLWNEFDNITLYPVWQVNTYKLNYYSNGKLIQSENIEFGTNFTINCIYAVDNQYISIWSCDKLLFENNELYFWDYDYDLNLNANSLVYKGNDFIVKTEGITAKITGYVGNASSLIIPSKILLKGIIYDVTEISDDSFKENTNLVNIYISEGISKIGSYAFYYATNIENIALPSSIIEIGGSSFSGCEKLTNTFYNGTAVDWFNIKFHGNVSNPNYYSDNIYMLDDIGDISYCGNTYSLVTTIEIPNEITILGNHLMNLPIKNIVIPDGVTSISDYAFYECDLLETIEIPESVTSIGSNAFYGCVNLEYINIPYGVESIEYFTFYNCSNLKSVEVPITLTSIGNEAFYNCEKLENITLHEGLKKIDRYAFYKCKRLKSIYLPSTLEYLGTGAFRDCRLTDIVIPDGITNIYSQTFLDCNIKSIYLPKSITEISESAFDNCNYINVIFYAGTVEEWNNVKGVANYWFNNSYVVYNSTNNIEIIDNKDYRYLLYNDNLIYNLSCKNKEVENLNLTTEFDNYIICSLNSFAFSTCSKLKEIVIPEGLVTLGAFSLSSSCFETVVLPSTLIQIGKDAFCNGIIDVYYNGTLEEWLKIDFKNANSNPNYYGENFYILDENGTVEYNGYKYSLITYVEIPNSITKIDEELVSLNITDLVISKEVEELGYFGFVDCKNLVNVYYNGTLEDWFNIKMSTYMSNPNYFGKNFYILDENGTVEYNGYKYSLVTNLEIPSDIKILGCHLLGLNITNLVIPEGVEIIDRYAFYNCINLETVILPSTLTKIYDDAFNGCINIKELNFPSSLKSIGFRAFSGCSSLKYISLPDGIESVDQYAFEYCSQLETAYIPKSIKFLGMLAFYYCDNFNTLFYEGTPEEFDQIIFGESYHKLYLRNGSIAFEVSRNIRFVNDDDFSYIICDNKFIYNLKCLDKDIEMFDLALNFDGYVICSLGNRAFQGCTKLESIIIPNTITNIGSYAFYDCLNLKSVYLPNSVKNIDKLAFNCQSLTVYCEAEFKPSDWDEEWVLGTVAVIWSYKI